MSNTGLCFNDVYMYVYRIEQDKKQTHTRKQTHKEEKERENGEKRNKFSFCCIWSFLSFFSLLNEQENECRLICDIRVQQISVLICLRLCCCFVLCLIKFMTSCFSMMKDKITSWCFKKCSWTWFDLLLCIFRSVHSSIFKRYC